MACLFPSARGALFLRVSSLHGRRYRYPGTPMIRTDTRTALSPPKGNRSVPLRSPLFIARDHDALGARHGECECDATHKHVRTRAFPGASDLHTVLSRSSSTHLVQASSCVRGSHARPPTSSWSSPGRDWGWLGLLKAPGLASLLRPRRSPADTSALEPDKGQSQGAEKAPYVGFGLPGMH